MAKKKDARGGGNGGSGGGGGSGACRPAHSRVSFLFQAAALLAQTSAQTTDTAAKTATEKTTDITTVAPSHAATAPTPPLQGMARRLLVQMRAVSRKTNMRVRAGVKQRVCRYCDTLLVEGATCTSTVENASRSGRKPWADVLVVACHTCGRPARRYPVSAPRQPRRPARGIGKEEMEEAKRGGGGQGDAADGSGGRSAGQNKGNPRKKQPAGRMRAGNKTAG